MIRTRTPLERFRRTGQLVVNCLAALLLLAVFVVVPVVTRLSGLKNGKEFIPLGVVVILALLPAILKEPKQYYRLWQYSRVGVAELLYHLLLPLNLIQVLLPRLARLWIVAVIIAVLGGYLLIRDHLAAPLADQWMIDVTRFFAETAIHPRYAQAGLELANRGERLSFILRRRYPSAASITSCLAGLYAPIGGDSLANRIDEAVKLLGTAPIPNNRLDAAQVQLLRIRLNVEQSHQGDNMDPVLAALGVFADSTWRIPPTIGPLKPAEIAEREQWRNLWGGVNRFCAEKYATYQEWSQGHSRTPRPQAALFQVANRCFEAASHAPAESGLVRIRGFNNRADLMLARMRLALPPTGELTHYETAPTEFWLRDGERELRTYRDELRGLLAKYPDAAYCMTIAQVSATLFHSDLYRYMQSCRNKILDRHLLMVCQEDAGLMQRYLDMSLALGVDRNPLISAPHSLGLCPILYFGVQHPSVRADPNFQSCRLAQEQSLTVLGSYGIRFRCEVCEHRWPQKKTP